MFVPGHTVWLLSDNDVKARVKISKRYLQSVHGSLVGLEALQRKGSLSKTKLSTQVIKTREIKRALSSIGSRAMLSVHAPYTPIGEFDLASSSGEVRKKTIDAIAACVELAESIGAKVVNTHLGGIIKTANRKDFGDPETKKATLKRISVALNDLTGRIEGRNVLIAIENVPYPLEEIIHGYSPLVGIFSKDFSEILEALRSKDLGVTVDFCHLWITHKTLREYVAFMEAGGSDLGISAANYQGLTLYETDSIKSLAGTAFQSFVKPLCERIVHIHAADSDGTYVPGRSNVSEGKTLGEGDLDLDGLAASLRQIAGCSAMAGSMMIVLESKEADLGTPINSLRSMLRLNDLIKEETST